MRRTPSRFLVALVFSGLGLPLTGAALAGVGPSSGRPGVTATRHGGYLRANRPRLGRRAVGFADYVWGGYGYPYRGLGGGLDPVECGCGDGPGYARSASPLYPSLFDLPAVPGIRNDPPAPPTIYVLNPRPAVAGSPRAPGQRLRPSARIISLARSSGAGGSEPDESYRPGGARVIHITVPRGR